MHSITYMDAKKLIVFNRIKLTHLDPIVFRDADLPIELFINYDEWIASLATTIKELDREQELVESD